MNRITISAGEVSLPAELNDSPIARQVWEALPIEGRANIWGDEIYFEIPVVADQAADARAEVEVGELVKIIDGPFKDFVGKVSEIDEEKGKVRVLVNMFGRDTPVELDSLQIKKL